LEAGTAGQALILEDKHKKSALIFKFQALFAFLKKSHTLFLPKILSQRKLTHSFKNLALPFDYGNFGARFIAGIYTELIHHPFDSRQTCPKPTAAGIALLQCLWNVSDSWAAISGSKPQPNLIACGNTVKLNLPPAGIPVDVPGKLRNGGQNSCLVNWIEVQGLGKLSAPFPGQDDVILLYNLNHCRFLHVWQTPYCHFTLWHLYGHVSNVKKKSQKKEASFFWLMSSSVAWVIAACYYWALR
jgi:hypothetical protein